MTASDRVVAFAETVGQASAAQAISAEVVIVAMNPAVDYWRESQRRSDPTIEDLCNETELYPLGEESIEITEKLADRVEALSRPILGAKDAHADLSLRGYFHYLKANYDGVLIRLEQLARAFEALKPAAALSFRLSPWHMTGLTSFDKPAWSLTTHLLANVAQSMGVPIRPCEARAQDLGRSAGASARQGSAGRLAQWIRPWRARRTRKANARAVSSGRPVLLHSLFEDLGKAIVRDWERRGGAALALAEFLELFAVAGEMDDMPGRCATLWEVIREDPECDALLRRRGVSLWPYLGPLIREIVTRRFPGDYVSGKRAQRAFTQHRPVILSGGMVEANYVVGRLSHRAGVPFVSHHYGGFLGFSLLPMHERYDMAECDYFLCGGPAARDTFLRPSPLTRWRPGTRRARPVATGIPWVERLARTERASTFAPGAVKRVMVVLNALVGDCRYLGYVFPPEIAYWRFTRRLVQRLSREPLEVIVKSPLEERYPQQRSPLEDWIASRAFPNVRLLRGVPLSECLGQADAFVLEGPSTPLLHVVSTPRRLLLYADRKVYRLVPEARSALRRRASVFAETEEEFFLGLDGFLERCASGREQGPVDDTFLERFCIGGGGSLDRVSELLWKVHAHHPLDEESLCDTGISAASAGTAT